MTKKCSKCGQVKNIEEFTKKKSRKDGHNSHCKECTRKKSKEHYYENRKYYLEKSKKRKKEIYDSFYNFKKSLKCERCGDDRWYVLDFHHIDFKKKDFDVSRFYQYGREKIEKELEKCMVLCSNCHREVHYLERIASSNSAGAASAHSTWEELND